MTNPAHTVNSTSSANTTNSHEQSALFAIYGMTCQACATRLEKVLNKKPAIISAQVNFASETAQICFDDTISTDDVIAWIQKAGFEPQAIDNDTAPTPTHTLPYSLIVLWVLSVPFWVGMIGMMVGTHALMPPVWVQFVLASVVQFWAGLSFYKGAWASIKGGLANMDVLIALGTSAIWGYSLYVWLTQADAWHGVYFEASVMVIAFISLGKYLEARTKKHSLDGVSALLNLVPTQVMVKRENTWQSVALSQVQRGDVLQAVAGDKVACDGVVLSGAVYVDEAHLTGESRVVVKETGMTVLAGSPISDGSMIYQAQATGKDTLLGEMADALSHAQNTKADIARLADRVAGVFVPLVVWVAVFTLVGSLSWGLGFDEALLRAVSVLVIACPCALGLATPTAIMAGMGLASRHGVVFKDATSLEQAGQIDVMVFDKTGTLTQGKPTVVEICRFDDEFGDDDVIRLSASVETHAKHPLAHAIVALAKQKDIRLLPTTSPTTVIGQGVSADIDGVGQVKVGTPAFVGLKDVPTSGVWERASLVALSVNDKPVAVFALADTAKDEAKTLIKALHQDGIDVQILSGDRQAVVDDLAGELGISHAYGDKLPQDKLAHILHLQSTGKKVAMTGDGVNDAPAMATADASFAVDGASDVARQSASAYLVGSTLIHAYYAQKIAKLTLRTIKQNLFFAFIYNVIGIPLAMFGVLTPMLASLAMALSSLSVLINALRLKRVKPFKT